MNIDEYRRDQSLSRRFWVKNVDLKTYIMNSIGGVLYNIENYEIQIDWSKNYIGLN